ncbi:hypothetical protein DFR68_1172 [Nocardia mexicana]|uniref:Uncharacterized protein n=1 Tax=Nocardia mexicana TaxID=279262 RepID=A0A370GKY1_9NOCA|nr:hypothetical protein [Nocardia mexicana]RDI44385.1 hypothetical protein DFR68_1172 [Nocardia mexicana]
MAPATRPLHTLAPATALPAPGIVTRAESPTVPAEPAIRLTILARPPIVGAPESTSVVVAPGSTARPRRARKSATARTSTARIAAGLPTGEAAAPFAAIGVAPAALAPVEPTPRLTERAGPTAIEAAAVGVGPTPPAAVEPTTALATIGVGPTPLAAVEPTTALATVGITPTSLAAVEATTASAAVGATTVPFAAVESTTTGIVTTPLTATETTFAAAVVATIESATARAAVGIAPATLATVEAWSALAGGAAAATFETPSGTTGRVVVRAVAPGLSGITGPAATAEGLPTVVLLRHGDPFLCSCFDTRPRCSSM